MSAEMFDFYEEGIKPLITEWIALREENLEENELILKLKETHDAVTNFVLFAKNCGFVKQFVVLVNTSIKETNLLKRAINENLFEGDLERLITSAHFALHSLTRFSKHYSEDMKPFKPMLKHIETNLISALEELPKFYPRITLSTNKVIRDITTKNRCKSICFGSIKPTVETTLATASCAMAFLDCGITIAGLSFLTAYKILESYHPEEAAKFTQRDLNLIGLRAAAKTLQNLVSALREKMIYEEDFGKHARICSKIVRLIEDQLNKLNDLMLYKVKNENEMRDTAHIYDNYFTIIDK